MGSAGGYKRWYFCSQVVGAWLDSDKIYAGNVVIKLRVDSMRFGHTELGPKDAIYVLFVSVTDAAHRKQAMVGILWKRLAGACERSVDDRVDGRSLSEE